MAVDVRALPPEIFLCPTDSAEDGKLQLWCRLCVGGVLEVLWGRLHLALPLHKLFCRWSLLVQFSLMFLSMWNCALLGDRDMYISPALEKRQPLFRCLNLT